MRNRSLPRLLCPLIIAFAAAPSTGVAASFEWLPAAPDFGYANAEGMSGDGATAVGDCSSGPESGMTEACRWRAATGWRGLGFLRGHDISEATGVSVNGNIVVGDSFSTTTLENQAFRWTSKDGMTGLGFLPGTDWSVASAVSANGNAVAGVSGGEPFRWTRTGGMQGLGFLPGYPFVWISDLSADGAVVVGQAYGAWPSPREAFRWTQANGMQGLGFLPAPFDFWSNATAASADGSVVVGTSSRYDGDWIYGQAVVWRESCGCLKGLGFLSGGVSSGALDVSADGTVIVGSSGERAQDGSYRFHAVVWTPGGGLQKLTAILESNGVEVPVSLDTAVNVSADGQWILGQAYNDDQGQLVRTSFRANIGPDIIDTGGAGELGFESTATSVYEGEQWGVFVERTAGTSGAVSVQYAFNEGTASSGQDFAAREGTLTWADGEGGSKAIGFSLPDDTVAEGTETFSIVLSQPTGGANIAAGRGIVTVHIEASDDTGGPPPPPLPPPANDGGGGLAGAGWLALLAFLRSLGARSQHGRASGVPRDAKHRGNQRGRLPMRKLAGYLAMFGLASLTFSPPLHAAGYRFVQIDFPGSVWTATYGINARGHVVGRYFDADDVSHSFVLRNGEFTSIDVPGATEMLAARGINSRGDIVGNYVDSEGTTLGYLLSDGEFQRIRYPGAEITLLSSINDAGDIVGLFFDQQTEVEGHFIRKGGRFQVVTFPSGLFAGFVRAARNNGRVLVGTVYLESDGGGHGFVRTARDEFEIIDFPGQAIPCSHVRFMNEGGDMVGEFAEVESVEDCNHDVPGGHGYLYRDGEFTALDFPGASATKMYAINSDRVIVGTYFEEDGTAHGFKAIPRD